MKSDVTELNPEEIKETVRHLTKVGQTVKATIARTGPSALGYISHDAKVIKQAQRCLRSADALRELRRGPSRLRSS